MRGKWILISIAAVAAGAGLAALSLHRRPPAPPPATSGAAVLPDQNEVTLSGKIRPQHVLHVGAAVEGNIDAFQADVGDEVFEGQVLARIGGAGLETARQSAAAAVDQAQGQVTRAEQTVNSARLEQSRADATAQRARLELERVQKVYARQRTLNAAGATPRLTYEKALAEYQTALQEAEVMDKASRAAADLLQDANNQLTAARKNLDDKNQQLEAAEGDFQKAELRAPAAGLVVARKGELGKPASEAGEDMFQIATDLYALEVPLEPTPPQLKRIHPGQPALVLVLDLQSAGIPGGVKEVKDQEVIVEFNSTMPAIRPGMRADVRLKLE
jgi:multidrug resistance efflux pump